jgi:hypothetical protein
MVDLLIFDTTIVNIYVHTVTEFDDCEDDVLVEFWF